MFQEKKTSLFFLLISLILLNVSCRNKQEYTPKNTPNNNFLDSIYSRASNPLFDKEFRINECDSLLQYSEKLNKLSFQFRGLMLKTSLFSNISMDSAIYYSMELRSLARINNDSAYIGKALVKLGLYNRKQNKIKESFKHYNEAFIIFKSINDSINVAKSLLAMSKIKKSTGDFIGSRTAAIDGLDYLNIEKDTISYVGLLQNISTSFREEGNYTKALQYNKQALQISPSNNIQRILKNTEANILADLTEYDRSIEILTELREQTDKFSVQKKKARILNNLGYVKWLKDSTNGISLSLLQSAYAIRKKSKDIQGLISSCVRLTQYYENINLQTALGFAEEAFESATEIDSKTAQLEALDYIIKLKDNPKKEAKLYTQIDKSLTKINQQNRELYSVTKYENDKLIKQNLIIEADNLKKEKLNTWYLLGFVITTLISILIYVIIKNKHTKEKRQKVYETEARISKKIHDELANDVYSTMIQLENKSATIPEIIDDLEDIYQNARDISQEKSVFRTNKEFVSNLKRTLGSFTSEETNVIVKGLLDAIWIDIPDEKKVTTLRVLKELLINMKKHSKATIVSIIFLRDQNNLKVTYMDNGVGVYKDQFINGTGLINAENRIQAIGGKFIFDETTRKGLKIDMNIPI